MKTKFIFHRKAIVLIFGIIYCMVCSCKKDHDDSLVRLPAAEHVVEVLGLKGGMNDYKKVYHYQDGRLSEYFVYLYHNKGEWKEWLKHHYEYPAENRIIETRMGLSDSVWYPTHKYEKVLSGDELKEMVFYDYDDESPGKWRPVKKIEWTFQQGRPLERMTYRYPKSDWEKYIRSVYEYEGTFWTGLKSYKYIDEKWDTLGCMLLIHHGGNLDEIDVFECHNPGWTLNEQYLLNYDGMQLTHMIINERSGDSLNWDRTISVNCNENGNPHLYN